MKPYVVRNAKNEEFIVLHPVQNTHDMLCVNLQTKRLFLVPIYTLEEDFTWVRLY